MIHQVKIFNLADETPPPVNGTFSIKFSTWIGDYDKAFGLPSEICEELTLAKIFMQFDKYADFKKTHYPIHFDVVNLQRRVMFNQSTFFKYLMKKHIG